QPFISGAISKTVNLPHDATVEDVKMIYVEGWKRGLKAIALYRDGCKMSQPLSSRSEKSAKKESTAASAAGTASAGEVQVLAPAKAVNGWKNGRPARRRLPARRTGFTIESRVAGHQVFLRTGEYEDGSLGEIFIDMHKEGAAFRSMMNCFAIAVSKGLQYGVPLEEFVDTFTFTRFEPQGPCDHPNIKMATSVVDYIFRVLGLDYLKRTDLVQVKPVDSDVDEKISATESASEAAALGEAQPRQGLPSPAGGAGASGGAGAMGVSSAQPVMAGAPVHAGPSSRSGGAEGQAMTSANALDSQLSGMMGDAPFCDNCGHITVRNGACYKCLNCGSSIGCS
ncbi:vitamin B12-dependent ribonucleotide reductase, partial [Candidatus Sumerlaeota bacterium]|nr:vitamin B12-dependent ribonucleotide reductase [Candidatus Sumerlaeota bacterium]